MNFFGFKFKAGFCSFLTPAMFYIDGWDLMRDEMRDKVRDEMLDQMRDKILFWNYCENYSIFFLVVSCLSF